MSLSSSEYTGISVRTSRGASLPNRRNSNMALSQFRDILLLSFSFSSVIAFAASKCYPKVGCFDEDLSCHRGCEPENPKRINTQFFLYTPESPLTPEVLEWRRSATIRRSNFRRRRETKFIIHGFNDASMDSEFQDMKDALLSIGDFNVIIVDWSNGARLIDFDRLRSDITSLPRTYNIARQNTRVVGRELQKLTEKLRSIKRAEYSTMHLIGHSLGAQIAGYAGEYVNGQYGRITGLDPAGPGFEDHTDTGCFLEETDAEFVDIIHTSTVFGYQDAVGHQDFYPSGGQNQVSCFPLDHICYHKRVVDFFLESITTSCSFQAFPCTSWARFLTRQCRECGDIGCSRMGYYADLSPARGSFMLGTATSDPYCLADSGVPPSFWKRFG